MKLYTDISHYEGRKDWKHVPHVIRPFFEEGIETDAFSKSYLANSLEEADYAILPMTLEYYYISKKEALMCSFINKCRDAGKLIVAFNDGDNGVRYKLDDDVIVLCQNAYQSKRHTNEYGNSFIVEEDPMQAFFNQSDILIREKGDKPVVGFDGLGGEAWFKVVYHTFRNFIDNLKYLVRLSIYIPNRIIPATILRTKALDLLEKDNRIVTNFHRRKQFRAGAKDAQDQRQKSLEFYKNMLESDYVLCVRGVGNFSKRFYETLAMGRIPVFIDTDCVLPFDNIIDWRKCCVWVDEKDLDMVADKVAEYHTAISNEDFKELQRTCRRLWENHLSRKGVLASMETIIKQK